MLSSNAFPVQFPGKQAHLNRESQSLLSGHGALDLDLNRLRGPTRVGKRHGKMVSRRQILPARNRPNHNKRLLAGATLPQSPQSR